MSILDIFRQPAQPVQQPAPQQQTPPGNIPNPTTNVAQPPGAEPNGVIPEVTPTPAAPTEPESPLDPFKDLWETAPIKEGEAPAAPQELTAEALQKTMANANFTSGITPETLTTIQAGGEEATAAFSKAMNEVARQVMVQSTLVGNKLTAKAVEDYKKVSEAAIPDLVRKQVVSNHLNESNPVFQNPAIKPFIEAAQAQLLAKHPTATPAELTNLTSDLMGAIRETFTPPTPVDPAAPVVQDWEKFLQ